MATLIGVLGEAATASIGVTTAYIVPANNAAKCKIMYSGVAGVNSTLSIAVNGITIFTTAALTSGNTSFSTSLLMHNSALGSTINGGSDATTVAPGPKEYYLAAGDTVTYTVGTANFSSLNVQVVGTQVEL